MTTEKQSQLLFSTYSVIRPQLNAVIFGTAQRFKRQLHAESGYYYVFNLTCVRPMPGETFVTKLHFGNKQNSQTVKHQIKKFSALTTSLNHKNTTECAQNVYCEPRHERRDGDATDWWLQQQSNGPSLSIRLTVSVSVLQDVVTIKRLGVRICVCVYGPCCLN